MHHAFDEDTHAACLILVILATDGACSPTRRWVPPPGCYENWSSLASIGLSTWLVVLVLAIVAVAIVLIYNGLVRARALVREGWSGIAVQLRRRRRPDPQPCVGGEGLCRS